MRAKWQLVCTSCRANHLSIHQPPVACPYCGGTWLEPVFNYAELGTEDGLVQRIAHRRHSMWRYRELLPLNDDQNCITMGEGGTPLLHLKNLGLMLGCPNLYLKDERQGPTGSFKDRQASLAISVMKEHGIREAVVASTGNVAIAYSAYATQAGIKLWAFLTSTVPADKMREVALYGTEVVKVSATYDRTKQIAAQFAERKGLHLDRGIRSIAARESMKTLAYEISEDLGYFDQQKGRSNGAWRAPDWYFQAVSGGMGPVGVHKGFKELKRMGLINKMPKIASVQAAGCAPMVHAWEQDSPRPIVVHEPRTRITTVATGAPGIAYEILYRAAKKYGGTFIGISDEEAFRTMHIMAKMDGISMEPAAALACAAAIKMVREGAITPDQTIVICCSGHTFPVEKHLLDEKWTHDIDLSDETESNQSAPSEGLLASLEGLGRDVGRIAIVEDDPSASLLLRRILQAQGNYEILEATDGLAGLQLIRRERPDLILLDLMMPNMDGYTVIEELKKDPDLHEIPVIVITAAHLNPSEKARLKGQTRSLLRKGTFVHSDLLADIEGALR
ncbi:MAG: pyridoxal-phosphate dependent enzyme [Ardenticatenaceae bacterium]